MRRTVGAALWPLALAFGACRTVPRAPAPVIPDEPLRPAAWAAPPAPPEPAAAADPPAALPPVEPAPVAGPGEVLVYRAGEPVAVISRSQAQADGLWVLDVGSEWVPALFRSTPERPHGYEPKFIELANGRFDESYEGRRAAQERYLEPHGIPPTPLLLSRRFAALSERACREQLPLAALREFKGAAWDEGQTPSLPEPVLSALQARLACEGHLRAAPSGELDQETRRALEEFERRNRIYARGSLQSETLAALRAEPLELERRALVRALLERAVLELGVIEDGSAFGAVPSQGADRLLDAANVVQELEQRIVEELGLGTITGAERFYRRLTEVLARPHYGIAIAAVELPDYYSQQMALSLEIDRGDLYYEFPFDEQGRPLNFKIERGPTMTLFGQDGASLRPLVRYPTTIGGWRVRRTNGSVYWQYKESKTGVRAWKRIVAAPVWLPPPSTPSETLVATFRRTSDGSEFHELNMNLIGPSFASAYGLVAAHHQHVTRDEKGALVLGPDDGMRTHGSSDYTSIWRTVSSGCHRLHNHLAMRLISFVLAHRTHRRVGHLPTRFRMRVSTRGFQDAIDVSRTGYHFELDAPLEVRVLPGRIRGELKHPLSRRFPAAEDPSNWPTLLLTPTRPEESDERASSDEPAPD